MVDMQCSVTSVTQSHKILFSVLAAAASKQQMMYFRLPQAPTDLAAPSVPMQHLQSELL